jgi:hypothetical protein
MNFKVIVLSIGLSLLYSSCCLFIKEEYLGNNFILSEYDNVDIRILYSEEKCSGSGIDIVPMTVLEYAYDAKWIIAKSGSKKATDIQYWVVDKDFKIDMKSDHDSSLNIIKDHVDGPYDSTSFMKRLHSSRIISCAICGALIIASCSNTTFTIGYLFSILFPSSS